MSQPLSTAAVARVRTALAGELTHLLIRAGASTQEAETKLDELANLSVTAVQDGAAIVVPTDDDDARSTLGVGIHTGLRKGTDAANSHIAWKALADDESGWDDALEWAISILADDYVVLGSREL